MPSILNYLKRPEYVFRPAQVIRRLRRLGKPIPPSAKVKLPWGLTVKVRTNEHIGSDIFYYGIFDRIVPEVIHRLADEGELAVEAGANIGQNCSLMVSRTGPKGRVIAFEPHPDIFQELKFNVGLWPEWARQNIQLQNVALGETDGEALLVDGSDFHYNRGSASLTHPNPDNTNARKHKVLVRRLDDFIPAPAKVGVCKIDVEGHELAVLKGAQKILERRAIRDIIFEDFNSKPSAVTEFLAQFGFTIFELRETWLKPRLASMRFSDALPTQKFSFNYLATLDPARAKKRFRSPGWQLLLNL